MSAAANTKKRADQTRREGILANHVRSTAKPHDPASLSRSFDLPRETVARIIRNNGG